MIKLVNHSVSLTALLADMYSAWVEDKQAQDVIRFDGHVIVPPASLVQYPPCRVWEIVTGTGGSVGIHCESYRCSITVLKAPKACGVQIL